MAWFNRWLENNRRQREVWRTIPGRSVALVAGCGFCVFASVAALAQLSFRITPFKEFGLTPLKEFWLLPLIVGAFAAAAVWAGRRPHPMWGLPMSLMLAAGGAIVGMHLGSRIARPLDAETDRWISATSIFTVSLILFAWLLAFEFIKREGQRLFRAQTEMQLAEEIHKRLVPTIECRIGDYEFYGSSQPSGLVGGDLVDVFECEGHWVAYVTDVCGHGVDSGIVMAMIKSAIHTAWQYNTNLASLLDHVNHVLCSLQMSNMFATCGLVSFSPERGIEYALAGHPPMMLFRRPMIETLGDRNLPLGIFPSGEFLAAGCDLRKGDVLVIVTDGLTEVTASDGEEIGFRGISQALQASESHPLRDTAAKIFATSKNPARSDDQSLLMIRRLEEPPMICPRRESVEANC